jgi:uncharacterized protein (TIGR00369 family)
MRLIGARICAVEAGRCAIELPIRAELTQQDGFVHGGIVGMIADSAGGYAAFTLMAAGASVLTVEYKINMLAPATGERLIATGQALKVGRTLAVARADVHAIDGAHQTLVAAMQQTLIAMHGASDGRS